MWWVLAAYVTYKVGAWFYHAVMNPSKSERAKRDQLDAAHLPRAEQGSPVPVIWGRVKVDRPNVVWTGAFNTRGVVNAPGDVIATEYSATIQMVLGAPGSPDSLGTVARLKKVWANGLLAWSGDVAQGNDPRGVDAHDLFGGPGLGGGPFGALYFTPGTFSEAQNPDFLATVTEFHGSVEATLIPTYRGLMTVILYEWTFGETPDPGAYAFEVMVPTRNQLRFAPDGPFSPTLFEIGDGDANPISVLYDIFTNDWSGLGLGESFLDLPSWQAAGNTLAAEANGYSRYLTDARTAGEVVAEICQQCDLQLYWDPRTTKLVAKLIRDDYVVGDLLVLDQEDVLVPPDYQATTWELTKNQVRVTFQNRAKDYGPDAAVAQDKASIFATGRLRSVTRDFPGVMDATNAAKIAARELKAESVPTIKLKLTVNRKAQAVQPGDVIVVNWTSPELSLAGFLLRVAEVDYGTLEDGRIILDGTLDKFAFDHVVYPTPPQVPVPDGVLQFSTERYVTEAPRWFAYRAALSGRVSDPDAPRDLYIAAPRGDADAYMGQWTADDGATWASDEQLTQFPATFTLAVDYPRDLDPIDTTTGLAVQGWSYISFANRQPQGATPTEIFQKGVNLILVGGELMAFTTVTSTGPDAYLLGDGGIVYRGLLDTPCRAHAAGERGYLLNGVDGRLNLAMLGMIARDVGDIFTARVAVRDQHGLQGPTISDLLDAINIRGRCLMPLPPADLRVGGAKSQSIVEDGIQLTWKQRDRESVVIQPGTDASGAPGEGVVYDVYAQRADQGTVQVATGATGAAASDVPLGRCGHGAMDVSVKARSTTTGYTAWEDPAVPVVAPRWRNLMLNPRFSAGTLAHWTTASGSSAVGTNASLGLGKGGDYLTTTGSSVNVDVHQDVDVLGYPGERLRAVLDFYSRNINSDSNDTIRVDLVALDASGATLATATYGPLAQSTTLWNHRTVEIANLPAYTTQLRVRVRLEIVGDPDGNPDSICTEFRLRLGQVSDQLLTNADFESGLTGWTTSTFAFSVETANPYTGSQYLRGRDFATCDEHQDQAIPAGYEYGTAVLEVARMNDAANDTGTVMLQALSSTLTVLATSTTGAEAISPSNVWQRRRLQLDLPDGAAYLRVTMTTSRVTSPTANTCFDDLELRVHKWLDVQYEQLLNFGRPAEQPLPRDRAEWDLSGFTLDAPDYAMIAGDQLAGHLGVEPDMASADENNPVIIDNRFAGVMVSQETPVSRALDFSTSYLQTDGNTTYANFKTSDGFTFVHVFKSFQDGIDHGLLGRLGTTGWSLEKLASGVCRARLVGAGGTKQVSGTTVVDEGAPAFAAIIYDPDAATLYLVDAAGTHSVSTAGMGEIRCDELIRFAVGRASSAQVAHTGQACRTWAWGRALDPDDVRALWTHGDDPTGVVTTTRTQTVCCAAGIDPAGGSAVVARFAPEMQPWTSIPISTRGDQFGLLCHANVPNLCPTWDTTDSRWTQQGPGSYATDVASVEGIALGAAAAITGTNTTWLRLDSIPLSTPTTVRVVFWANSGADDTARVVLTDAAENVLGTFDYAVTTLWTRYEAVFTTWNHATPTGRIRWLPTTSGVTPQALSVSAPVHIHQGSRSSLAIPLPGATAAAPAYAVAVSGVPAQFNSEGELWVEGLASEASPGEGLIATVVGSGGGDVNRRDLYIDSTHQPNFDHWDHAGAAVPSVLTAQDWGAALFSIRGRWCRAGLLDAAADFADLVFGDDLSAPVAIGRTAAWSWAATDTAPTLVQICTGDAASAFDGLVRQLAVRAREMRLTTP